MGSLKGPPIPSPFVLDTRVKRFQFDTNKNVLQKNVPIRRSDLTNGGNPQKRYFMFGRFISAHSFIGAKMC